MDFIFFLLHLFAPADLTCLAQYDNVCEVASLGSPDTMGLQVGEKIYVRAGNPFMWLVLKHEQCHVQQYREGRRGEDECFAKMWA